MEVEMLQQRLKKLEEDNAWLSKRLLELESALFQTSRTDPTRGLRRAQFKPTSARA